MELKKGEGVGDFVLLDEISENQFMENLKLRYAKQHIYVSNKHIPITTTDLYRKRSNFCKPF